MSSNLTWSTIIRLIIKPVEWWQGIVNRWTDGQEVRRTDGYKLYHNTTQQWWAYNKDSFWTLSLVLTLFNDCDFFSRVFDLQHPQKSWIRCTILHCKTLPLHKLIGLGVLSSSPIVCVLFTCAVEAKVRNSQKDICRARNNDNDRSVRLWTFFSSCIVRFTRADPVAKSTLRRSGWVILPAPAECEIYQFPGHSTIYI